MNEFDIKNIKKELEKRRINSYDWWSDEGTISMYEVEKMSVEELKKLLNEFNNNKKKNAETEIKKLVDEIFAEFGDEEDNMIILGGGNYYNEDRCFNELTIDDILRNINFNDTRYNPHAHPVGHDLDVSRYGYRGHEGNKEDDKKFNKLVNKSKKLADKLSNLPIKSIDEYWSDNNEALNEMWCGCHAITKDYKIYAFVIRDDGLFLNARDGFESFWNHVLYTIK